jgi:hypothetical protein
LKIVNYNLREVIFFYFEKKKKLLNFIGSDIFSISEKKVIF